MNRCASEPEFPSKKEQRPLLLLDRPNRKTWRCDKGGIRLAGGRTTRVFVRTGVTSEQGQAMAARIARPPAEDVSDVVRTRRRIARTTLYARIVGWPLLIIAAANVGYGRIPALIGVVLGLALLWAARASRSGSKAGGTALLVLGTLGALAFAVGVFGGASSGSLPDLVAGILGPAILAAPGGAIALGGVETLRTREPEVFHGLRGPRRVRRLRLSDLRQVGVVLRLVAAALVTVVAISLLAVSGLITGLLLLAAVWLVRQAMARAAPAAGQVLEEDQRPPLLYLRSFADDEVSVRARWDRRRLRLENVGWPARDRFEEVVTRHLARYGPIIAVGQPGERVPKLGAAREYLPGREWQQGVRSRMQNAAVVAVVLGRTGGLEWELAALVETGTLARTLLVVPPVDDAEIQTRWHTTATAISRAGGPTLQPELVAGGARRALVIVPDAAGRMLCGNRRDEWHYETALHRAVSTLAEPA